LSDPLSDILNARREDTKESLIAAIKRAVKYIEQQKAKAEYEHIERVIQLAEALRKP
jgi:hypothetical protein